MNISINNARVINPDGSESLRHIHVKDGVIINVSANPPQEAAGSIDAAGKYVLPGFIDLNCDVCDPGYENREDMHTASKTAAKGGFTSITCLPTTQPVIDNNTAVRYVTDQGKKFSVVNILPYGAMTKGNLGLELAEMGEMKKEGIAGVSDGNVSVFDASLMRNIMLYASMFDLPVITFCENRLLSEGGAVNHGKVSTVTGLKGKLREAEDTFVARNLILAFHSGSRLHITHVSTRESVALIRFAKERGVKVTCDTCPHYFTLTEEAASGYDTFAKVNPPLRAAEDVEAVKEGLRDGTIDAISTGHSPVSIENKRVEFDRADFGISSLETAFALSYTALVRSGALSLRELSEKLSANPAKILKLEGKGEIREGCDADLVIADTESVRRINAADFASKAKFSPYDGREAFGVVAGTMVSGKMVYIP
ncbi:MAG: dihydroorotase [Clostridiales bacterium]|nr:dihydroorotase [Clostridiales bacterium]